MSLVCYATLPICNDFALEKADRQRGASRAHATGPFNSMKRRTRAVLT
jgi:hypothetical protein